MGIRDPISLQTPRGVRMAQRELKGFAGSENVRKRSLRSEGSKRQTFAEHCVRRDIFSFSVLVQVCAEHLIVIGVARSQQSCLRASDVGHAGQGRALMYHQVSITFLPSFEYAEKLSAGLARFMSTVRMRMSPTKFWRRVPQMGACNSFRAAASPPLKVVSN